MKRRTKMGILCLGFLSGLAALSPLAAADDLAPMDHGGHDHSDQAAVPPKLVKMVRDATRQYLNVNNAGPDYKPMFGCITGPDHGAMGVHYINGTLAGDDEVLVDQPEALIYEPSGNGLQLVGVEYIVDAKKWLAKSKTPPQLEGQAFQYVGSPNRYGIPAFFELHVWAWRNNPQGAFVDWNNNVTCEHHP